MTTAIITAPTFPIDNLLTCAKCQGRITLAPGPEPRYICPNSCVPATQPSQLNRLLLNAIMVVTITDRTFPMIRDSFLNAWAETHGDERRPSLDEIQRFATDPETYLATAGAPAMTAMLATCVRQIQLDTDRAIVHYAVDLPPGTVLAGSRHQEVKLPLSVQVPTDDVAIN